MMIDFPGSRASSTIEKSIETRDPPREGLIRYPCDHGGNFSARVLIRNRREKIQAKWNNGDFYEAQRHGMLNYAYQKFRGGTFVDIGASIGNHTLFFYLCCKADRVLSFEPVPTLCEHLVRNLELNGLDETHVYNVALGAQACEVGMLFRELPIEQGGMLIGCIEETGRGTPMQALDSIMVRDSVEEIRCIKIDIEGYSLPVLQGAAETIAKYRPAIFCECETRRDFDQVNDFLTPMGYRAWRQLGRPFAMNYTPTYLWEHLASARIVIAITSYNRPAELKRLLDRLNRVRAGFNVTCLVYDDCSDQDYGDMTRSNPGFRIHYRRMSRRHGKEGYWRLINKIMSDAARLDFDFFMQLPDDVEPVDDFFERAVQTFDAIDDPARICLNLYLDNSRIGRPNWTKSLPTIEKVGETSVFRTGWMDMIFMADRRFFGALNYSIEPVPKSRWARNPELSSGVGMQITRRLRAYSLYQTRKSLLKSLDIPSRMHPARPAHEDLSSADLDPIICGVASIPNRQPGLERAVQSVLPYVDALCVYLNGYRCVPQFLKQPKVTVYRSQDRGDLGDAGKFFKVGDLQGFYIAIDDDIVYPEDYVWRMVNAVRRNQASGRRLAVTMHGRVMANEVQGFYRGHRRIYHFASSLDDERAVHVPGTGVLAFHTGDLELTIGDFTGPRNMADIHFAIACQRQDVGCVVLPHERGYLRRQNIPGDQSIWGASRKDDAAQTELFNSWKRWRLRA